MNPLMILALHLESEGLGSVGESIFVNELPEHCEKGIVLYTTGEGLERHTNLSRYYRGSVLGAVRAKSFLDGEELSYKANEILDFEGLEKDGVNFRLCKPEMLPQSFGKNEGGYIEWQLSFEVCLTL